MWLCVTRASSQLVTASEGNTSASFHLPNCTFENPLFVQVKLLKGLPADRKLYGYK